MDDLDLRSIGSRTRTNAEIYTRLMLSCVEGLPCWRPKPLPGTQGIIPGDVGTFDLTHGFRKLFNIWEEGSEGRLYGTPPRATVQISSSHFPEGHTIASGASSSIRRSSDGQCVKDRPKGVKAKTSSSDRSSSSNSILPVRKVLYLPVLLRRI
jgi:hypothetical protein